MYLVNISGLFDHVVQFYGSFLISAVVITGLLIWMLIYYAHARQPKAGTLEWIEKYDKPVFSLVGDASYFTGKDILFAVLSALGAFALFAVSRGIKAYYLSRTMLEGFDSWELFKKYFECIIGGAGMYFLVRSTVRERISAIFAALLFGIVSNSVFSGEGFLIWSLVFLWRWIRQDNSASFWESAGWLFGSAAMLALHVLYTWASIWILGLYLFAFIAKMISRAKTAAEGKKTTPIVLTVILTIVLVIVASTALWFVALLREANESIDMLRVRLTSPENYLEMLRFIPQMLSNLIQPFKVGNYTVALVKYPLVFGGIVSLICAFIGFIKRNETEALFIVLAGVLLVLEWLLAGVDLLSVAFLPALAYVWSGLEQRKKYIPICAYAGGMLAFYYINWLLFFSQV